MSPYSRVFKGRVKKAINRAVIRRQYGAPERLAVLGATVLTAILGPVLHRRDGRSGRSVRKRLQFDFPKHIVDIGEENFERLYRLSVVQFYIVLELIRPYLDTNNERLPVHGRIPLEVCLCISMRLLAGASYLDVGWPYGVGPATVFVLFDKTLSALDKGLPKISFPATSVECRRHEEAFKAKRRTPLQGIISALDGIAIAIKQPRLCDAPDPRKCLNRKSFYSLCVQAAVGADYKFLFVSARHAGATHDATAFRASGLYRILENGILPRWCRIAADDAYSNGGHILTPYSGRGLPQIKDASNFYLFSCRIIVEQAFGMLVCRFGIFWSPLRFKLPKCTLVIMVACKLHNFIIDTDKERYFQPLQTAADNDVAGVPTVYTQNTLHMETEMQRSRQREREESESRDEAAARLQRLGYLRPRMRR